MATNSDRFCVVILLAPNVFLSQGMFSISERRRIVCFTSVSDSFFSLMVDVKN